MATYYWVGGSGTWNAVNNANWSNASGGSGGFGPPISTDTVIFDSASGTGTCTTASGSTCLIATLNTSNLGVTLGDNHTMGSSFTLTLGALNLNDKTLTCLAFVSSNSNVRSVAFGASGQIILTRSNSTLLTVSNATNFSFTGTSYIEGNYSGSVGTRTIIQGGTESQLMNIYITAGSDIVNIGSAARNVIFSNFTGSLLNSNKSYYGDLTFSAGMTVTDGATTITLAKTSGALQAITSNNVSIGASINVSGVGAQFVDALTQGATRTFTITNGTVQLKSGATSTVGSFVANNANTKFLQSTTPGSQATISQASGTVTVADLTIQDSNATGGASWTAYADYENVDAGNNDGWDFSLSPPYASYEPPIIIRSFTQPRRF